MISGLDDHGLRYSWSDNEIWQVVERRSQNDASLMLVN